ncbi:hypothetical protein RB595_002240 [Gaeumannomyces hyphopodioides]
MAGLEEPVGSTTASEATPAAVPDRNDGGSTASLGMPRSDFSDEDPSPRSHRHSPVFPQASPSPPQYLRRSWHANPFVQNFAVPLYQRSLSYLVDSQDLFVSMGGSYEPLVIAAAAAVCATAGAAVLISSIRSSNDALGEEIRLRQAAEARVRDEAERAEGNQREAEAAARRAEEAAVEAAILRQEVNLQNRMRVIGFDPDRVISDEEIKSAREELGYVQGFSNIAIVGFQNAGKSSLCNSLRGVRHSDAAAAKVEESETTMKHDAYPDARHAGVVWHDLPGGGTQESKAFNYYYNLKLFAYDKLLLVHSSTLTELDIGILHVAKLREQPYVVARSKADLHIRNCKRTKGHATVRAAREDYLAQVRRDADATNSQAEEVGVRELKFRDHVVSEMGVRQVVMGEAPESEFDEVIEEAELLGHLVPSA